MHACMHSTSGSNHVEAGQTAGYGGYQLVGQSVDPPQAAKIPNPKPVQGEVGLAWSARVIPLSYSFIVNGSHTGKLTVEGKPKMLPIAIRRGKEEGGKWREGWRRVVTPAGPATRS